jgi:hypothetical protein
MIENALLATILVCFTIGAVFAAIGMAFVTITDIIDELKKRKK